MYTPKRHLQTGAGKPVDDSALSTLFKHLRKIAPNRQSARTDTHEDSSDRSTPGQTSRPV
jgi:hypothetical protein